MQKLDQAPKSADATPGPQSPANLDMVERTGATRFGEDVVEIWMRTASGRRVKVDLPTTRRVVGLSARKQKIMGVLAASPVPLTRLAVAHKCGLEDATGRFGRDLKELIESDTLVYLHGQEVTDDPAKFAGG